MPKISVIAPVYGVEKYIYQFMDSVIEQSFNDFEFIIVDDGSPDRCPEILDEYAKKDKRIRVIHQKNQGVAIARNTGIDAATGEYAYIVDSDDWLEKNALEILYRDAKKTGADCVMADCVVQKRKNKYRRYQFSKKFYTDDPNVIAGIQQYILCQKFSPYYTPKSVNGYAAPWGKFIKMSIIKDNHIRFDPYVRGLFDDGLFSLAVLEHVKSFYYGMEYVYNYRVNENSLTLKYNPKEIDRTRLGFEKIEEIIKDNNREERLTLPYYCHVSRFLIYKLDTYFFNINNDKTYSDIKKELKKTIDSEPFKTAINRCHLRYFRKGHIFLIMCFRLHWVDGIKLYREWKKTRPKEE